MRSHRRHLVACAGALALLPLLSRAQAPSRIQRVGFLSSTSVDRGLFPAIPDALRNLGYEEGRNIAFESRGVEGRTERIPQLAAELVAGNPDVIVVDLPRPILAVKRLTSTIPIVMVYGMVPEELGLIKSLARPGSNVTGTLIQGPEAAGKSSQIVREILPPRARMATLYESAYPGLEFYIAHWERAAKDAGLRHVRTPVRTDAEVEQALTRVASEKCEAMLVSPTGPVFRRLDRVFEFAFANRIAVISPTKWLVPAKGALLAFEPDLGHVMQRTAAIVDKILKGAKPADIPVEAPTRYELWLNLKSAQALGIAMPYSVRLQADRVFE